ncbi:hypothetical protein CISIN_1g034554mg [Citrus sinensis]|uniref:Uncharacterized protein n=1 Tax=Citrus sinensis TaxID=2711 RepID=A0A067H2N6_CITSI|nr:hypothetical protein CISIN_1g034554mg [Citrus sinensis]
MVLKGFNGLVDELAIGRGVPSEPVTRVTVEAIAVEHRGPMIVVTITITASGRCFLGRLSLDVGRRRGCGSRRFDGPGDEVSKHFTVLQRED